MKTLFFALLVWTCSLIGSENYVLSVRGKLSEQYYSLHIVPISPSFYSKDFTYFDIFRAEEGGHFFKCAVVSKPDWWHEGWTRSYEYTQDQVVISQIKARLFSFGILTDSWKYFDVYDKEENCIGSIKGEWEGNTSVKFVFYDYLLQPFAKAVIQEDGFSITNLKDEEVTVIAIRNFQHDHGKHSWYCNWSFHVSSDSEIDERFLWPFAAFVADIWWY